MIVLYLYEIGYIICLAVITVRVLIPDIESGEEKYPIGALIGYMILNILYPVFLIRELLK
jgi:hypothetical protein